MTASSLMMIVALLVAIICCTTYASAATHADTNSNSNDISEYDRDLVVLRTTKGVHAPLYYETKQPKHLRPGSYDYLKDGWVYNNSDPYFNASLVSQNHKRGERLARERSSLLPLNYLSFEQSPAIKSALPFVPTASQCGGGCSDRACTSYTQDCCSPTSVGYCNNARCVAQNFPGEWQCCSTEMRGFWWNLTYYPNRQCTCCSDSYCCGAGNNCCGYAGGGGCCATSTTCCGAYCCGNDVSTCCMGSNGNSTCCAKGTTCCNGQCLIDSVAVCCGGSNICLRSDGYDACGGSGNRECYSQVAAREAVVNKAFIGAMVGMGFLVFVVLCRSRATFYNKGLFDTIILLSNLMYPFMVVNQWTLAFYMYVHGDVYFSIFLAYVIIEFIAKNYFFIKLLATRPVHRQLYKMLVAESGNWTYISGFAVMWLFPYVAYLDTVKSNISIAASTWETVTGRRRYIDLVFLILSSACYIVNITAINDVAASEIRKSFFLLAVSLLAVIYAWYAWYGKKTRAHAFYEHKGHLRTLADVTIENTDVTEEEAEDQFIQFYVGGGSLIKKNEPPVVWYTETLFMIKDNRVVMCIYDKRAASYDVILLAMTADEYRKAAAATRRQTVSAANNQPNNDPKPQWKLQDAKLIKQVDFKRLRAILSEEVKAKQAVNVSAGGALSPSGAVPVSLSPSTPSQNTPSGNTGGNAQGIAMTPVPPAQNAPGGPQAANGGKKVPAPPKDPTPAAAAPTPTPQPTAPPTSPVTPPSYAAMAGVPPLSPSGQPYVPPPGAYGGPGYYPPPTGAHGYGPVPNSPTGAPPTSPPNGQPGSPPPAGYPYGYPPPPHGFPPMDPAQAAAHHQAMMAHYHHYYQQQQQAAAANGQPPAPGGPSSPTPPGQPGAPMPPPGGYPGYPPYGYPGYPPYGYPPQPNPASPHPHHGQAPLTPASSGAPAKLQPIPVTPTSASNPEGGHERHGARSNQPLNPSGGDSSAY